MMRFLVVCAVGLALAGCMRSVAIPPREAELKSACHGKDRVLASVSGVSAYRCGEGDQARYALYKDGSLVREGNEIEVITAASALHCIGQGHKLNTPQHAECTRGTAGMTMAQAGSLRQTENVEAQIRAERTAAAISAAAAGASAAIAASQPRTVNIRANCTTMQTGTIVNTNCY